MTIIYLRKMSSCTDIQKSNLLKIRNDVDIRNNMFTDHIITKSEHLEWLECCENDPTKIIYLVLVDDLVRGMVALTGFDQRHPQSRRIIRTTGSVGDAPQIECDRGERKTTGC